MCQINIYRDEKREENLLMEDVFSYEMDFSRKILSAYTMFGDNMNFRLGDIENIKWSEHDSSLVIKGGIERIVEESD